MSDTERNADRPASTDPEPSAPKQRDPDRTKLGAPMFVPLAGWWMRSKPKPDENGEIDPAWLRNYESEVLYSRVKFVLALAVLGFGLLTFLLLHWFGD